MDEAAIEKAGAHPLDAVFDRINDIKSVDDLKHVIAELHSEGYPAAFRFGGGPDQKNSNMVILNAGQGGLSLGEPRLLHVRDRIDEDDPGKICRAYDQYVQAARRIA